MKLTMLGIFTVLLVAALAAPAAAATVTLPSGSYIADVILVGGGGSVNTICGRVVASPQTVAGIAGTIVLSVDFSQTSVTGCNPTVPAPPPGSPKSLDLCYRDRDVGVAAIIYTLRDTNNNGKIDGLEGILKGKILSGVSFTTLEIHDTFDGTCGGTVLFRTGYRQP